MQAGEASKLEGYLLFGKRSLMHTRRYGCLEWKYGEGGGYVFLKDFIYVFEREHEWGRAEREGEADSRRAERPMQGLVPGPCHDLS